MTPKSSESELWFMLAAGVLERFIAAPQLITNTDTLTWRLYVGDLQDSGYNKPVFLLPGIYRTCFFRKGTEGYKSAAVVRWHLQIKLKYQPILGTFSQIPYNCKYNRPIKMILIFIFKALNLQADTMRSFSISISFSTNQVIHAHVSYLRADFPEEEVTVTEDVRDHCSGLCSVFITVKLLDVFDKTSIFIWQKLTFSSLFVETDLHNLSQKWFFFWCFLCLNPEWNYSAETETRKLNQQKRWIFTHLRFVETYV